MVGVKSELFNVEGFGAVNIRNRYRHKLEFHIHLYSCSFVFIARFYFSFNALKCRGIVIKGLRV